MPGIGRWDSRQPALGGWGSEFLGAASKDILLQELALGNEPGTLQETVLPNLRNGQCWRSAAHLEMLHQPWPTQTCSRKRSKWVCVLCKFKACSQNDHICEIIIKLWLQAISKEGNSGILSGNDLLPKLYTALPSWLSWNPWPLSLGSLVLLLSSWEEGR